MMGGLLPRWTPALLLVLGCLGMIPLGIIAKARVTTSEEPRIHLIHDMDNQPRYKAQMECDVFRDGRSMREPVAGTVARGELREDDHYERGVVAGAWADTLPPQLSFDRELVERGRERYAIHCAPCHGYSGYGDGMVHLRAESLKQSRAKDGMAWVPPSSYHDDRLRQAGDGYLFHVISNGIRNMSGYAAQISVRDRWAIVAWLRVIPRSQDPEPEDLVRPTGGNR